jgi:hypothetical protein
MAAHRLQSNVCMQLDKKDGKQYQIYGIEIIFPWFMVE